MKSRCNNPSNKRYKDYGGRGISYHPSWEKIENFYADMGERPSSKHSIDRINNDKGYSKDNCRWATTKEQSHNKRSNKEINNIGSSKYRGVVWHKPRQKWIAQIRIGGKQKHLGRYKTEEEAYQAILKHRDKEL